MKALVVFLLLSVSFSAFSNDDLPWKKLGETLEVANNVDEFKALMSKYPGAFRNPDFSIFHSASVLHVYWQYTWTSVCPEGDARLFYQSRASKLCYSYQNEPFCVASAPIEPQGLGDPCGQ